MKWGGGGGEWVKIICIFCYLCFNTSGTFSNKKFIWGGGWSQATRQWGENWKIIIFLKNQKDIFGALGNPFENQIGYVLAS